MKQAQFIELIVIEECQKQFPDACSEIEAIDLAAQAAWEELKASYSKCDYRKGDFLSIRYSYLNELRKFLNYQRIEQASAIITRN